MFIATTKPNTKQAALGQYPTPLWAAEAIVDRYFSDLSTDDLVIEPSCGPGRFLQALPCSVSAIGIDIDPQMVAAARKLTGRTIIEGDFCELELDLQPTAILGNPPFKLATVDRFLERAHALLPDGGRVGFLLPVYTFQTAGRVMGYHEKWSIKHELIPRNLYPGLKLPLMFALFSKDRERTLVGFALYRRTVAVKAMAKRYQQILETGGASGSMWRELVEAAIEACGGRAHLSDLYRELEMHHPAGNNTFKASVRKWARQVLKPLGDGYYAKAA